VTEDAMSRYPSAILSSCLASFLFAAVGLCQAVVAEPHVSVTLVVILAGEEKGDVDPQLAPIAEEIRKQNPQLKSFRLKSMTKRSLAENEPSEFDLVDGEKALVTIKHALDADNRVSVSVKAPRQGEIEYRTVPGKFLPIVTRYQTNDQQRLILAVRVDAAK
jgi:hypothetical protein